MAKFCQILTLFAQVMTSEANGANYGGYISAIGPKELTRLGSEFSCLKLGHVAKATFGFLLPA